MKKTLSVVLTSAMALSMFSSVAFGKTSADFTDLKDLDAATQAKFDAMISAGIFDGVTDTTFGLKDEMNRAQFAKVAALIMGLDVNKDLQTSTFTDVSVTDAANGYALPYIEALKTAGVTNGYAEGQYNPAGKVTKEQLATFLVRVLGQDAAAKDKTGKDTTVSGWAQGYVALALELKLLANGTDGTFSGQANATRDLLLTGAYEAKQQYVPAGKIGITEAKAAGVYKVTVSFNKPVDTTKASLVLTKGTLAVSATTTWSDDKKVATLTTDTKIGEGDYTVTLSGLDAATVAKSTATFKAQDEQLSKIDFINAGDTVAYSKNAVIKLKAVNQYGEAATAGTSNFTALVSGQTPASFKKDTDGNLVITADVTGSGISQGNGIVPVTVYFNNSNITVSKNFKVGTVPILSKIETGKVTYSNNGTKLAAADETASIALNLFDQYGNPIVKGQFVNGEIAASNINPMITPYEQNLEVVKAGASFIADDFFDENDNARVQVKLKAKVDKTADYTLNIYGGSSSATATISVGAANLATKVEFDTSAVTVAANDTDVYVPLNVTDANGNKLSAQDIVDNKDRMTFSVTNGTGSIQETGEDKGKLKLHFNVANAVGNKVYVTGQINQSQSNTFVQTSLPVQDARVAELITVTTEPAAKAILGAGDEIVYQLKDQYGKDISKMDANILSANGQTSNYRIKVEVTTEGTGANAAPKVTHAPTVVAGAPSNVTTYYYTNAQLADFNSGFDYTTALGSEGKVTVKAVIEKASNGSVNYSDYSSAVSRTIEAVKSDTTLTYSIESIGNLFAAQDKLTTDIASGETLVAGTSQFDKKLSVIAKDSAGNKVKLPLNYVNGISSSDPSVLSVATDTAGGLQDGYLIGNKAGSATVSAVVYTNKGETINLTQEVTVKDDAIAVDKLEAGNTTATYSDSVSNAYDYFTKDADHQLKVTDQYGITYKNADIAKYNAVLGLQYTVSVTSGTGTVTIDAKTGAITTPVASTVNEFLITAIAPNGKSVQVLVAR
ncbi:S-layer homology domain-containing protein [Paenibacillus sp. HWE-109]|uniref:S-layer homology domain-containing protein n=1 Tax=Paenibacillus sp. HWE-109 TaxID=1306526 RepID=UPI001EDD52F3|nr:S-layer homology domain-containing protein [Paenibacillus sp. HWE-109]UKS26116.1 S-layer homology domain-containing protein [Paenibacillus sp. HWE-109]